MLNTQEVTEAFHVYRRNKGLIKRLSGSDHPAIRATETYLKSLQRDKDLLSNQDLFNINRFFLFEHPVKPGKASYAAWFTINYQNLCTLNYGQAHFSKLTREHLDKKNNAEKMGEYFQVLSQAYQQSSFNDEHFFAFSKLCVEGMLTQDYVKLIQQSTQAIFLANCLIKMKHTGTLTAENQQFISAYSGALIIPVTHMLIALEKAGLNTLTNRQSLANFSSPLPLHRAFEFLEKIDFLTQENFAVISTEDNLSWLLALEEMPKDLITAEIWQSLLNLLKTSNENDFKKDVKDYAEMLKKKLNVEQTEKGSLVSKEQVEPVEPSSSARARFFSVTPVNPQPAVTNAALKVSFVPS